MPPSLAICFLSSPNSASHSRQPCKKDVSHVGGGPLPPLLKQYSLLHHPSIFCIHSFAAVLSRQPPLSHRHSSGTDHHRRPLTHLHHSALPLVSHRFPLLHLTLFTRLLLPHILHLLLLRCRILQHSSTNSCHTVVVPPPLSSLDSHCHLPLHWCVVHAHPPSLGRC